jgi:exopolyphosphatase/pppGpp-phosphohydrolase
MVYTVLEIGSGSFKLHHEGLFSEKFESSLGKEMLGAALNPKSVAIALKNLQSNIIPFLAKYNIKTAELLIFATAAVRTAISDPGGSGEKFLQAVSELGFSRPRVLSEDEECRYAALAVLEEHRKLGNFSMLDTGGASHQLVEFKDGKIHKQISIPLGSHSFKIPSARFSEDAGLSSEEPYYNLPKFTQLGFSEQKNLVLIGTSGSIITAIPSIHLALISKICQDLIRFKTSERRNYLCELITDTNIRKLFVDYRLEILPNALAIIINCAEDLDAENFLYGEMQAKNYISIHGF